MKNQAVLVINAGSSSIKFALFELTPDLNEKPVLSGQVDGIGATPHIKAKDAAGQTLSNEDLPTHAPKGDADAQHHEALELLLGWLDAHDNAWDVVAVGHRVVHGGEMYSHPTVLDSGRIAALERYIPLAPLHQPHNLDAIKAIAELRPNTAQVACFDTAFHRSQPPVAQMFALPRKYTAEGVRRYGFHGLSYEYIARVLPQHSPRADGRVVVAHLGNGASMCAMVHRRSVASTMGFTAVEGLMMGTRTGSLDPGVMLYLMDQHGMTSKDLTRLLYKESGLLGVSGISQDMRALIDSTSPEANEAVELFCYRVLRELGSLAAAAAGMDALVFTGGIGEHAAEIRRRVCLRSRWLGIELDEEANRAGATRISTPESTVDVLVIPTNEEAMIARHTANLLGL